MTAVRHRSEPFWIGLLAATGLYTLLLVALLIATALYTSPAQFWATLQMPEIRYSLSLSLVTATTSAALALLFAVPIGYLLARGRFWGRDLLDAALDLPIVLPPMVVGLCLLIFFQTAVGRWLESFIPFTYSVTGIILAQSIIGTAFAIRTMRTVFEYLSPRPEDVAMTLGCTRGQAVWRVTLPAARRGMITAFGLAWARSLGEFGPVLVFAGAMRMKTEVLPTSIFIELSVGRLEAAIAVSLLLVAIALAVLIALRTFGQRP